MCHEVHFMLKGAINTQNVECELNSIEKLQFGTVFILTEQFLSTKITMVVVIVNDIHFKTGIIWRLKTVCQINCRSYGSQIQ